MKFNVNTHDFYPNLAEQDYPAYLSIPSVSRPFMVGDVLWDEENKTIGMVLGCIDYEGGELRLDSDGMQPIENLRYATIDDFTVCEPQIGLMSACMAQI